MIITVSSTHKHTSDIIGDVSMKTRAMGELYERDGHTYLRLTKLESEPKVGDMRIYANGLVPDPVLSRFNKRPPDSLQLKQFDF